MVRFASRSRPLCASLALAVLLVAPGPAPSREQGPPQFDTAVDVFHIQVAVLDAEGRFVDGLDRGDFEVWIDGERRELVDAYPVDARTLEPGPDEPDAPLPESGDGIVGPVVDSGAPAVSRRRFLLLVDLWNLTRRGLVNARRAARRFLDDVARPADLVGLAISSPRFGLMYRVPFTVRHAAVADALEELGASRALEVPEGALQGVPLEAVVDEVEGIQALADGADLPAWVREVTELRVEANAEAFLEHLGLLAEDLASIQGRKHVLVFSHGLPDAALDPYALGRGNMVVEHLMDAAETARSSGVVLHTLQPESMGTPSINDVRNMQSGWRHPDPEVGGGAGFPGDPQTAAAALMDRLSGINDRAVLHFLAGETGGESSWFRHNLDEGAEAVEAASRRYYVLALPIRPDDPAEVRLDVEVRQAGAEVRGAPERLAVPRGVELRGGVEGDFRVAEALEIGVDASDMDLDLVALPLFHPAGIGRLALFATVPATQVRELRAARGNEAPELEVLGLALTRWGTVIDHFRGRIRLRAEGAEGTGPLRYYNLLVVPPGRYHVKLMIREPEVGAFASRSLQLEVPQSPPRGLAVAVAPLPVREVGPGDLVAGVDPEDPPEHRRGRPLEYPLQVGELTVAPVGDEVLRAGDSRLFFLRVRGLATHPFTGEPAPGFRATLSSEEHGYRPVPDTEVLAAVLDDAGVLSLLLRVRLAEDVPPGSHELRIQIRDGVVSETVEATTTLAVSSG